MNEQQAREVVLEALRAIAPEVSADEIDPRMPFQEQIDIDSMDFLNLVIGLQERTGVEIPERDYPKMSSLEACVDYLVSNAAPTRAG
jgi:acyl carrier protein